MSEIKSEICYYCGIQRPMSEIIQYENDYDGDKMSDTNYSEKLKRIYLEQIQNEYPNCNFTYEEWLEKQLKQTRKELEETKSELEVMTQNFQKLILFMKHIGG